MKKEHYEYVSERFDLARFCKLNGPIGFGSKEESMYNMMDLKVKRLNYENDFRISYGKMEYSVFISIPTKELANEIIQFIKDTEIFFL